MISCCNPSKTVILKAAHLTFKTKLSTMGSFHCWTKSYFSNNSAFNCCQVGFVKFWQNSWLLSTFVKAGPTFVLGLFWSNVNEGSPKFAFGNCPGLGNRFLVSIFKSSISHRCEQAAHHIMASSNKVIMGHSLEPTSTPVDCSVNWMGCIFSSPAGLCKLTLYLVLFSWFFFRTLTSLG